MHLNPKNKALIWLEIHEKILNFVEQHTLKDFEEIFEEQQGIIMYKVFHNHLNKKFDSLLASLSNRNKIKLLIYITEKY